MSCKIKNKKVQIIKLSNFLKKIKIKNCYNKQFLNFKTFK